MGGVAKAVTGAVDSVVSTVGKAVEDVGDVVVDKVVKPVANAVEKTVEAAMDDPVNTAIRVAAFAVGGPAGLAIANGTIALAQGQSFEDAALTAGKSYVIGQAGMQAGQYAGAAASEAGYGAYAANTAQGAAQGATSSALSGGDAQTGALMGALGGVNKSVAQSASDQMFEDWARGEAERAYDNAPSPTEQDVLAADPSIKMDFPLTTPTDATGPGYYDEVTGAYIPAEYGQLQAPLTDASGTNLSSMDGYTYDPNTSTWETPDGLKTDLSYLENSNQAMSGSDLLAPPTEYQPSGYDPLLKTSQIQKGLNFATNAILNGSSSPRSPSGLGLKPTGSTGLKPPTSERYGSPQLLAGNSLGADSTGDPFYLQQLKQLYSSLTPQMQQALMTNNGNASNTGAANLASNAFELQSPLTMASGGSADSSKTTESVFPQAATGLSRGPIMGGGQRKVATLAPLVQMSQQITRHAKGGLSVSHPDIPKDHKPEFITGKTGYYASGRGTGQSDDIPAVLHHGDFVMDADTVAALGDGSSKAGAQALEQFRNHIPVRASGGGKVIPAQIADGEYVLPEAFVTALGKGDNARGAKILESMRKNLREHKRSAPTSKIPPKAKSPLEYIKMGTKG